jgi:hypothetical protein
MHARAALGAADVTDDDLAVKVAALWGVPRVELLSSSARPVAYDVPSITTAARTWVTGTADAGAGPTSFRLFVKHVQQWQRSPLFAFVPPELREWAATTVPWECEALVYGSDLPDVLPDGLSMPRCLGVHELDTGSRSIWLEALEPLTSPWSEADYTRAARLLGRLSGSPAVARLAEIDPLPWHIDSMVHGRLRHGVLPHLLGDDLWRHPAVAATFDEELRDRLRAVAVRVEEVAAEFAALPRAASHGDACPGNLLRLEGRPGLVLIDFQFWRPQPLGHDLGQLLFGDLQLGLGRVDDVAALDRVLVEAYTAGLADEGLPCDVDVVRRAHAVSMVLFGALPAVPVDMLDDPDDERLHALCTARAALASFSLDLLDATAP